MEIYTNIITELINGRSVVSHSSCQSTMERQLIHSTMLPPSPRPCMSRIPNGNGTTNILNDHIQLTLYGFKWMLVKLTMTYVMTGPYEGKINLKKKK